MNGDSINSDSFNITEFLDAKGLRCPLPLLKTKQALMKMQAGELLQVIATDSGSVRDFYAYARLSGQEIVEFHEQQGVYRYIIRKAK